MSTVQQFASNWPTDAAGASDIGQWRKANQDHWCLAPALGLAAVADGMGGHVRGEEASERALVALEQVLAEAWQAAAIASAADSESDCDALLACTVLLEKAIETANVRVHEHNIANGFTPGTGMGTTLTGIWFVPGFAEAIVFNVGDSRVYRYHDVGLELLTADHTLYREWQDGGAIGIAPPRNIILRAIGLYPEVSVDFFRIRPAGNETFLLCSDGLNGMLDDQRITNLLEGMDGASAATISQRLIDAANEAGGEDNITVVTLRFCP